MQKLRSFIHDDAKPEAVQKKGGRPPKVPEKQTMNQPLVLASASAGILPGFVVGNCQFMQSSVNSAGVSLLKPNELVKIVREGAKENPIDVEDDSDGEVVESEESKTVDHYSVDGVDVAVATSEFDADEFLNEVVDQPTNSHTDESRKETLELDRMLRVT